MLVRSGLQVWMTHLLLFGDAVMQEAEQNDERERDQEDEGADQPEAREADVPLYVLLRRCGEGVQIRLRVQVLRDDHEKIADLLHQYFCFRPL